MENIVTELRKITLSFAKLESKLAISKDIATVLSEKLVHMERQCCTNAQYSWRECMEIVGIPSSVHHNQLEDSACKILDKVNCSLKDCNHLKGDCVIIKFFKWKDCKQVL